VLNLAITDGGGEVLPEPFRFFLTEAVNNIPSLQFL